MPKRGQTANTRVTFCWTDTQIKGSIPCYWDGQHDHEVEELTHTAEQIGQPLIIEVEHKVEGRWVLAYGQIVNGV